MGNGEGGAKGAGGPPEIKDDIPLLVQNLIGDQKSSSTQLTLTRAEAALFLWNHSVLSKSRRAVIDAGAVVPMCALLRSGAVTTANIGGKHYAAGALQCFAQEGDDELLDIILDAKPANALRDVLAHGTPEKQTTAAQCIASLAENPDRASRLLSPGLTEILAGIIERPGSMLARDAALGCALRLARGKKCGAAVTRELLAHGSFRHVVPLMNVNVTNSTAPADPRDNVKMTGGTVTSSEVYWGSFPWWPWLCRRGDGRRGGRRGEKRRRGSDVSARTLPSLKGGCSWWPKRKVPPG